MKVALCFGKEPISYRYQVTDSVGLKKKKLTTLLRSLAVFYGGTGCFAYNGHYQGLKSRLLYMHSYLMH